MGTFSKALAGAGGYIVASQKIVEYLRFESHSYIFQTAMPPAIAAGLNAVINIIKSDFGKELRENLLKNAAYFRKKLEEIGFSVCGSKTQIIPILIGDKEKAISVALDLRKSGILALAYYFPAVPKDQSIIRVNLMASHTIQQIDKFLSTIKDSAFKFGYQTGTG